MLVDDVRTDETVHHSDSEQRRRSHRRISIANQSSDDRQRLGYRQRADAVPLEEISELLRTLRSRSSIFRSESSVEDEIEDLAERVESAERTQNRSDTLTNDFLSISKLRERSA